MLPGNNLDKEELTRSSSNDECLGCETGCDYDGSHRDESGNYHPACCSRAAEDARDEVWLHTYNRLTSDEILDYLTKIDLNTVEGGDFAQQCLDQYAECKCCEAHQVNHPTLWSPWIDDPDRVANFLEKECKCDCRNTARAICRAHPMTVRRIVDAAFD